MDSAMSFDSKMPPPADGNQPMGNSGEPGENEAPEAKEESPEESTISLDSCPGMTLKVGDKLGFVVTSVDQENGTANIKYASSKPTGGGIASQAAAYDDNQEGA